MNIIILLAGVPDARELMVVKDWKVSGRFSFNSAYKEYMYTNFRTGVTEA